MEDERFLKGGEINRAFRTAFDFLKAYPPPLSQAAWEKMCAESGKYVGSLEVKLISAAIEYIEENSNARRL